MRPPLLAGALLMVTDAGHGETPPVPAARFARGDVVTFARRKALRHFPPEAIVAVAVPPGFPQEWALADLLGEARPLLTTDAPNQIRYILVNEGDPCPYIAAERDLRATGKERVVIGSIEREPPK